MMLSLSDNLAQTEQQITIVLITEKGKSSSLKFDSSILTNNNYLESIIFFAKQNNNSIEKLDIKQDNNSNEKLDIKQDNHLVKKLDVLQDNIIYTQTKWNEPAIKVIELIHLSKTTNSKKEIWIPDNGYTFDNNNMDLKMLCNYFAYDMPNNFIIKKYTPIGLAKLYNKINKLDKIKNELNIQSISLKQFFKPRDINPYTVKFCETLDKIKKTKTFNSFENYDNVKDFKIEHEYVNKKNSQMQNQLDEILLEIAKIDKFINFIKSIYINEYYLDYFNNFGGMLHGNIKK
jgi:hypothetical protein